METAIKDLEVLSKYLSEEELKDVAKQAAYDMFVRTLGKDNPHSKDNLDFYIKHGAYQAVVQHASENEVDIQELSKSLNARVAELINGLQSYQIPFEHLISEAVEANRKTIETKVNTVLEELVTDDEKYDSVYQQCVNGIGEHLADVVAEQLKASFTKESK